MAGNCQKLKWNRRALKLTQKEFAKVVGLDVRTIDKLEHDEDAWDVLPSDIADRIYAQYGSMASYQPSKEEVKEILGTEKKSTRNMGSKCNRLRSKRLEMGLSQKAFAEHVGLSVQTIYNLERDETWWRTIKDETADKIMKFYDSMVSSDQEESEEEVKPEPEKKRFGNWSDALTVNADGSVEVAEDYKKEEKKPVSDLVNIVEDPKALAPVAGTKLEELVSYNNLTDKDRQLMKYVEFACDQMKNSKTHEDFITNVDILTRIIEKQY